MQYTLALALVAASFASAQGVSGVLTPPTSAPPGCKADYPSSFEITVVLPASKKRDVAFEKRAACGGDGVLVASLKGGILTDAKGRIGAIVANHQFQFDGPPAQTGSLYTGGWSVCGNGSLAIGGSAVFYQCLSGTFYNLYDQSTGAQCSPVEIDVIPCGGGGGGATQGTDGQVQASQATQATDGQVQASSAGPHVTQITDGQIQASSAGPKVTQIPDGQIQASSAGPKVTQIPDGQIQASSAGPKVSQIPDGQVQASSAGPKVSQIPDGQVQASSAGPKVSQIPDGQVQASSAGPKVTQISDGQVQVPTGAPVSQYTDGQLQVPTGAPVSQISDGQVQAPTGAPVSQISDGQIQATLVTSKAPVSQATDGQVKATGAPTTSKLPFTGAAAPQMTMGPQLIVGAIAVAGFAMM